MTWDKWNESHQNKAGRAKGMTRMSLANFHKIRYNSTGQVASLTARAQHLYEKNIISKKQYEGITR